MVSVQPSRTGLYSHSSNSTGLSNSTLLSKEQVAACLLTRCIPPYSTGCHSWCDWNCAKQREAESRGAVPVVSPDLICNPPAGGGGGGAAAADGTMPQHCCTSTGMMPSMPSGINSECVDYHRKGACNNAFERGWQGAQDSTGLSTSHLWNRPCTAQPAKVLPAKPMGCSISGERFQVCAWNENCPNEHYPPPPLGGGGGAVPGDLDPCSQTDWNDLVTVGSCKSAYGNSQKEFPVACTEKLSMNECQNFEWACQWCGNPTATDDPMYYPPENGGSCEMVTKSTPNTDRCHTSVWNENVLNCGSHQDSDSCWNNDCYWCYTDHCKTTKNVCSGDGASCSKKFTPDECSSEPEPYCQWCYPNWQDWCIGAQVQTCAGDGGCHLHGNSENCWSNSQENNYMGCQWCE